MTRAIQEPQPAFLSELLTPVLAPPRGECGAENVADYMGACQAAVRRLGVIAIPERPVVPLAAELGNAATVWCVWRTGSLEALRGGLMRQGRTLRIIMSDPASKVLAHQVDHEGHLLTGKGMMVGEMATIAGARVAVVDGDVGANLILVNPFGPGGWARVEFPVEGMPSSKRPGMHVKADAHPDVFAFLRQHFCQLDTQAKPLCQVGVA